MLAIDMCYVTDMKGKRYSAKAEKDGHLVESWITPKQTINARWMCLEMKTPMKGKRVLANGFQSWSHTFMADNTTWMPRLNPLVGALVDLKYFGEGHFYKAPSRMGVCHSHEYLRVFKDKQEVMFVGSLIPQVGYGIFEVYYLQNKIVFRMDIEGLTLNQGERFCGIQLFVGECAKDYFKYRKLKSKAPEKIYGWTSWYYYYTKISEQILAENIAAIQDEKLDLDIFQIDDGFATHVGDWLSVNKRFPSGMKHMTDEIKQADMNPGLWLAPFACEAHSKVFSNKNLLLKDQNGNPQVVGYNPTWSGKFYGLDIYHLETQAYLERVFKTVIQDWGYTFLKLDFLYATAILPRAGKTRAMVMHDALKLIREWIGDVPYIACGCPIGVAAGMCDYMRVGPDISLKFEDKPLKMIGYRERICTKANMNNTENRWFMNGYAFMNDPDVFILRNSPDVKLTDEQKKQLFELNMEKSGLVFFSDNVSEYDLSNAENVAYLIKRLPHHA